MKFCARFLLSALMLMLLPMLASAQIASDAPRPKPSYSLAISAIEGSCPNNPNQTVVNCDCYPGLANRLVGCIRQTLHNAAKVYFDPGRGMHSIVASGIGGIITLGVVIYGVMLASGMVEKLGRDTFVLLIKIALVSYFVVNTQMLYNLFIVMIDSLATDMFQFSSSGFLGVCMNKFTIWERMDCMIDSVIGIQVSEITSSNFKGFNQNFVGEMMQRGMIGTFFHLIKSSSFGFVIGLMGFLYIYAMLFFLVRVLLAFLMSFFSLTFVMMIGPIFIPLVIFRSTKQYFDAWVKMIISSSLQPVLLVAFISFAIAGLDLVVFSGSTSVMRVIAGNAATQQGFNLNTYITPFLKESAVRGPSDKGQSSAQDFSQVAGVVKGFVEATTTDCLAGSVGNVTQSLRSRQNPTPPSAQQGLGGLVDCARTKVNQLNYKAIDLPMMAAARNPAVDTQAAERRRMLMGQPVTEQSAAQLKEANSILEQKLTQEMFGSAALSLMMMFLMFALMRVVPVLTNDLSGEARYTPGFFTGGSGIGNQLSGQFSQMMRGNLKGQPK